MDEANEAFQKALAREKSLAEQAGRERAGRLSGSALVADGCETKDVGYGVGTGSAAGSALKCRLVVGLEKSSKDLRRNRRALAILTAHPEFEELLELLAILNVIPNVNGEPLPTF
jgi:hypothetical protein